MGAIARVIKRNAVVRIYLSRTISVLSLSDGQRGFISTEARLTTQSKIVRATNQQRLANNRLTT